MTQFEPTSELDAKAAQLRRFRDKVLTSSALGKELAELITEEAPTLAAAVFDDEEAFGLAVKALQPWILRPTNFDVLEAELDSVTVGYLCRLADRMSSLAPHLAAAMQAMKEVVQQGEGAQVRTLLESGPPFEPKDP